MTKGWAAGCAFASGIGAASFSFAADGELRVGAGLDYSKGTYGGSSDTTVIAVPVTVRYEPDRWTYKLTVPFLKVTGPADFVPGVGRVDNSGKPKRRSFSGTTTESGVGDSVASATYNAWYDRGLERGLDLTGRVKLPSGDAGRGLGTGSTDVGFQVDAYQTLERLTVFWNRRADRLTRFQAYVLFGLANGSPDIGVGLSGSRVF